MTRLLFAILSLTIIAQSALAQFAADSGKETRNSVVFQNPAETETQPESDLFQEPQPLPKPQTPPSEPIRLFGPGDVKIIAVVNGEMISSTDIEERAKAFVINAETKKMIIAKVIQSAIDEKLKLQEAERQGIEISDKEIDASIQNFEQNNKIPAGQLKSLLAKEGVSMKVFREQMKSDLAWIRVIRRQLMAAGNITDKEIEESINQSAKDMMTPKYMVSEIVIKKENAKNLDDLVANLRRDPRFELYAAQFSESPSASNGGNLGWLNKGQLAEPLDNKVLAMKEGEVSDPIQIGNEFYILKLVQVYNPKRDKPKLPSKEEMKKFMENKKMEENFDIREQQLTTKERDFENALRPLNFEDFSGQDKVVDNLRIFVKAARLRAEALDHVLLHGPPGLGKTTLSNIIANELGVGFKVTSGPVLDKPGDLAGVLTSLEPNDVLFIDEIHRLSPVVEEYLYSAMEDYRIDIMIDKGPSARSIQLELSPFTLVGATTRSGLLTAPLRARFGINLHLEYYDDDVLTSIIRRSATILNVPCDVKAAGILDVPCSSQAAGEIASRSRGTPRIANALLRRVRDFAQVKGSGRIDVEIARFALEALNIDRYGLDEIDNKILCTIIDKFKGGPVGLTTIATALGEDAGTIEEVYEPFLIKEGFLKRTPRGREVTELAYMHLGRSIYNSQKTLFDD